MNKDSEWLAEQFEHNRPRLTGAAYRMLGSQTEAEDALQETWIRINKADASQIQNVDAWLTTATARVCLNFLRSRNLRKEEEWVEPSNVHHDQQGPEHHAVIADSIGLAMLVVLETLSPAERIAFVLHDMFAVSFDEIANIIERTPATARQLASRGRRRIQGSDNRVEVDFELKNRTVDAFLSASREGDFDALMNLLDPNIELRADASALNIGASEASGARSVAEIFFGRAKGARLATIDGIPGLAWSRGGEVQMLFDFTVENEKVIEIEMIADKTHIEQLNLT